MSTSVEFIEYVYDQIYSVGNIRYKKMFGEYMVYINDKPILLVCDSTVYVKQVDAIVDKMKTAEKGIPYKGAKEHYILDIDDQELSREIITILEPITALPKLKRKKS